MTAGFLKRRARSALVSLLLSLFGAALTPSAVAQATCLQKYFKSPPSGIMASDAEDLVAEVKIAQQVARNVKIVECPMSWAGKVVAYVASNLEGVPDGEYIVYDATWMSEVIGENSELAFMVIAHEIGHFTNGDYAPGGNGLKRAEQELAADRFAACSAARAGKSWESLKDLLSRIRPKLVEPEGNYHDRFVSIHAAKETYELCKINPAADAGLLSSSLFQIDGASLEKILGFSDDGSAPTTRADGTPLISRADFIPKRDPTLGPDPSGRAGVSAHDLQYGIGDSIDCFYVPDYGMKGAFACALFLNSKSLVEEEALGRYVASVWAAVSTGNLATRFSKGSENGFDVIRDQGRDGLGKLTLKFFIDRNKYVMLIDRG